ncbi:hypothetical protein EDB84DRAFT_1542210 [Lactarius hengduanensis]|nr:hypothetical protein EDB84DRAFT_1542210 [Lactarius hengduanensis]
MAIRPLAGRSHVPAIPRVVALSLSPRCRSLACCCAVTVVNKIDNHRAGHAGKPPANALAATGARDIFDAAPGPEFHNHCDPGSVATTRAPARMARRRQWRFNHADGAVSDSTTTATTTAVKTTAMATNSTTDDNDDTTDSNNDTTDVDDNTMDDNGDTTDDNGDTMDDDDSDDTTDETDDVTQRRCSASGPSITVLLYL